MMYRIRLLCLCGAVGLSAVARAAAETAAALPLPPLTARTADGQPKNLIKLSQYDKAIYCDLAVGADRRLHAAYTEQPDPLKAAYLYYRSSSDGGSTWSEPRNLSSDESGLSASYARLVVDGQGRLYAIWKYIAQAEGQDGPGGHATGILAYRCLEGGAWSRIMRLNTAELPVYSWFAAAGPAGAAMLVFSQVDPDTMRILHLCTHDNANVVQQVVLDGGTPGPPTTLLRAKRPLTDDEAAKATAAGHPPTFVERQPRKEGLINLRGYFSADGRAHFVAEQAPALDDNGNTTSGRRLVLWNGSRLVTLHTYPLWQQYMTYNDPPALLLDPQGQQHLLRSPEQAEAAGVRDYPIDHDQLGDPVDVMSVHSPKGAVQHWQATQLPDGRMAVTATLSETGTSYADLSDMHLSLSDGQGRWSAPLSLTDNKAREQASSREVGSNTTAVVIKRYRGCMASVAAGGDGRPQVLMVNIEQTSAAVFSRGANGGQIAGHSSAPMVLFLAL